MSARGEPRGFLTALACAALLTACAGQRDHFYSLVTLPGTPRPPAAGYATHVILSVSIPPLADRLPMTVDTSQDQLLVLEHERWAAPLSELVTQTLARDIEQRRADVLVARRNFDLSDAKQVRVQVDVVRLSARQGGLATLEAHWSIADAGAHTDRVGGETFTAQIADADYAAIARAFSACLASLADRLAEQLPAP